MNASALRASPAFRGLAEPWLRLLAEAASRRAFAAGEELATDVPSLYLLVLGEVSASTPPDPDGVREVVGDEATGNVFVTGEEDALVYTAVTPVEVYAWELPDLELLFDAHGELSRQLEARLSLRRRTSELVDLLRRTPLFRNAGHSLLRWLAASSTLAWFESGTAICRQGDEGDAMFLVVSGEVDFFQDDVPDSLRQLHRGDFFGEIALVRSSVRTASAVAASDAEVLIVGREAFDVLHRRSSSFRHAVLSAAHLRLESDTSREPDAELVWLVNDTGHPTDELAALVVDALREVAGDEADATYVVRSSDTSVDETLARRTADAAGGVVFFTDDAAAPFPYGTRSLQRVHHVVLSADGSARRRGGFTLALGSDREGEALRRLARAISHRRVGVALGGGAAWGFAHVALLRGLERARIPVDTVVGVSMGSVVGAFYASQGARGLDRLVDAKLELSAAAVAAVATTSSVGVFLRRHIPERRLEDLALPFATVAVEAQTGREKVFRHGSLATAVRASCSLPGVFGRPLFGRDRYLDACVRQNVPVRHCVEADVDFVIACDVVPGPRPSHAARTGLKGLALELLQVNRVTDTVRALYWLASDSGASQAGLADAVFSPDLAEFAPWDFHRADAVVDRAEEQLDRWLPAVEARYRALARRRDDG